MFRVDKEGLMSMVVSDLVNGGWWREGRDRRDRRDGGDLLSVWVFR